MPTAARHTTPQITDDLITRSVSGDKDAVQELATACLPKVWRTVFLACGGGPDVDDIAQNALIDAFKGLSSYRGTGNFTAWLNRVTVRAVYRHARKRSLWSMLTSTEIMEREPAPSDQRPDHRTEERRINEAVAKHLSRIKVKNRVALVLSVVHGYSVAEIAATEGCNIEAAKKRLQRGRVELGARLKKDPYLSQILREVGL